MLGFLFGHSPPIFLHGFLLHRVYTEPRPHYPTKEDTEAKNHHLRTVFILGYHDWSAAAGYQSVGSLVIGHVAQWATEGITARGMTMDKKKVHGEKYNPELCPNSPLDEGYNRESCLEKRELLLVLWVVYFHSVMECELVPLQEHDEWC